MHKCLERHKLLKRHKEETKAPNKFVVSKEIELIIKSTHEEKPRPKFLHWYFLPNI